ncbi:hypothetical protein WH47_05831 [Habropoda laboriosa]|uniref:ZP domain-containing protein n=1 Tax=Habropoda laboriosa TaxID=597456 RepID=A0A0L7QSQ5_9HYME|nr:hypothetical protein WH47_05831 [Habropoda laboriosa]
MKEEYFSTISGEIWEQDLSMDMQIGASTEGYDRIALYCGADEMAVELQTSLDFSGVIYTQGSFHSRQSPCFLDPILGGTFIINIPFNECATEKIGNRYKNILILQHDDELITPGDAAFVLKCDFSKVGLNETDKKMGKSSISLVDADPGRDEMKRFDYVESETNRVVFMPHGVLRINDEL